MANYSVGKKLNFQPKPDVFCLFVFAELTAICDGLEYVNVGKSTEFKSTNRKKIL